MHTCIHINYIDVYIHTECCVYVSGSVSVYTYMALYVSKYKPPLIRGMWLTHLTGPMSLKQMHVTHPSQFRLSSCPYQCNSEGGLGIPMALRKLRWNS